NRLLLITGPNMASKSTYMRQVAHIVLLAQIGSFVPAETAHIGVVDGIYTRVGASDDLAGGDSTFMVEMKEVAVILKEATPRSLLILDEIGRGTSTFDGLAIAWAVMEAISDPQRLGCRTLFATHYHELTDLEDTVQGLKNYHVAVERQKHDITFLHRIESGATDDSFGVEVAKLAGVPMPVVERARELLQTLEASGKGDMRRRMRQTARPMDGQMDLFSSTLSLRSYDEIIEQLRSIDIHTLTPLDALNQLYDFHRKAMQIDKENGDEPN
ncbi:MAG TPA: DNA mismatch repair protein MutS, partial [Clostridiaceae bacterium]|nr:DNA mismatch repair protein MutS [Clostridiaceae bacterium]